MAATRRRARPTRQPLLSYWNGKSGGRLSEPGLKPCGVHFFGSARGDAARNGAQDAADGLVLLHYPLCHFATWRHKFNVLDATQRSDWGHYRAALKNCGGDGAWWRRRKGHRGIL